MRNGLPRSLPSPGEPSLLRPARRACGTWLTKLESGHRVLESSRVVTSPNRQVGEGAAHPHHPPTACGQPDGAASSMYLI